MYNDHPEYPERTCYDKKARNYRYRYDIDFKKYHWNDLSLKERDYWRGLVQVDKELNEQKRSQAKKAQGTTKSWFKKKKE